MPHIYTFTHLHVLLSLTSPLSLAVCSNSSSSFHFSPCFPLLVPSIPVLLLTVSGRSRHTELEFSLARKCLLRDLSKINSFSLEGSVLPNKYKISLQSLVKILKYGRQNKHPKDLRLTMRSVNLRS